MWGVRVADDNATYDFLWQITQKEKHTNELQLLPRTFYHDIDHFLKTFDRKDLTEEEQALRKNTLRIANELYERRKTKITIYVAYRKPLPQPAVPREQDFYNRLLEAVNGNRFETAIEQQRHGLAPLKSLQTLPEIMLPSGRKAGPFEKGQTIEVSDEEEDIKFLINNTICQRL